MTFEYFYWFMIGVAVGYCLCLIMIIVHRSIMKDIDSITIDITKVKSEDNPGVYPGTGGSLVN